MPIPPRFGPNHDAVEAFLASLHGVPWFTRVGQPTDGDERLVRVGFEFIADRHPDRYGAWGEALPRAESAIERLTFEHRRLDAFMAVQEFVRRHNPAGFTDEFLEGLAEKYPGYYGDTCSYAHELVDTPDRFLWGAAHEIMLADVGPGLNFFQGIMPWFRAGYFPCGWEGDWPEGKLVLW
jgi:hypothetical protein